MMTNTLKILGGLLAGNNLPGPEDRTERPPRYVISGRGNRKRNRRKRLQRNSRQRNRLERQTRKM